MRSPGQVAVAMGAYLALGVLVFPAPVATATRPAPRSVLVMVDGDGATAAVPDGSARAPLPWLRPGDRDLAVSPSGRRLAFSSARTGNRELYVADIASGNVRRLTWSRDAEEIEPAWGPDGFTLVWASGRPGGEHDLRVARFDGAGSRRLTAGPADDREPDWSPDTATIAFASNRQGAFDLWTVAAAGGEPALLLDAPGAARAPAWHPSGGLIAYTGVAGGRADVWVTDTSGGAQRLVSSLGFDGRPAWSPDGRRLAFLRGRGGTVRPWIVRVDGSCAHPVAGAPGALELSWNLLRPELAPDRELRLPDLDQRAPADLVVRGLRGRYALGFTSATDNLGDGAVWLRGHRATTRDPMRVEQLVAGRHGAVRVLRGVGVLRYEPHPPHRHWHLDDFVRYELRRLDDSTVVRGRKSGFCLVDRWGHAQELPGVRRPPRFTGTCATLRPNALRVEEGSTVGYTDRYPAFFHGQDLDLTGVAPGLYVLAQDANPERRIRELDYGNNAASVLLRITWPAGRSAVPRVDVLRSCERSALCAPRQLP